MLTSNSKKLKGTIRKLWQILSVPDSLWALLGNVKADILFVLPDASRSLIFEKKLLSPHVDPLILSLSKTYRCVCIARPVTMLSKTEIYQKTLSFNWLYILMRSSLWDFLISRFKPKMIIGVSLHGALVSAAKKQGCVVIELYHGFGRGNSNSVYFSKFSDEDKSGEWPSGIVVFDDQTYATLKEELPSSIDVLLARNYWYDFLEFAGEKHLSGIESSLDGVFSKFDKTCFISLQHGYDGSREHLSGILENGLIHDEVLQLIKEYKDILFVIKPHPVQVASFEWKEISSFFCLLEEQHNNVVFHSVSKIDVFSLLMLSDFHITMSSGTIFEAGLLNVPSIGLCPTLQKGGLMQDAFKVIEESGLFDRGVLNGRDLRKFVSDKVRPSYKKRVFQGYMGMDLPLSQVIVSKLLSEH